MAAVLKPSCRGIDSNACLLSFGISSCGSDGKATACDTGDPGSILGLGRFPGEGNGQALQYSYLENFMNGGAW